MTTTTTTTDTKLFSAPYIWMLVGRIPSGAWQVSAMVEGHLVTRTYYHCTEKEAVAEFRWEMASRQGD